MTFFWEAHMSTLAKWATGRNVLVLLAVFLLFNFVVIPALYPKFTTLDTLPSYTPEQAYQHLESYGSEGRQQYLIIELTLDLIYPLTNALFFSLLIIYSFQRGFPAHPWTRWLALIPLAELAVDYLENASVVSMLLRYPERMPAIAAASNVFTIAKFSLTAPELIFVVGLGAWLIRSVRSRARPLAAQP
jgi:hypothetical protein